jgi:hypothetical protein
MKNYSNTQGGILVIAGISYVLINAGFTESCKNEIITIVPTALMGLWAWYKRYQVGDITIFGTRKNV